MHKRNSIINIPLLIGIGVSIAIHVGALYSKGFRSSPPIPIMEQGRTVVQLTLIPSISSQPAAEPIRPEPQQSEEPVEKASKEESPLNIPIEPTIEPALLPAPAPEPTPEPERVKESETPESVEQEASLIEEKGVTSDANRISTFRPTYPRISKKRNEEGTTTLFITVLADGSVSSVEIITSSGYRRLDEAAVGAAKKSSFAAARKMGRAVNSSTELSFTFKLTND
jgi:protein TonB